jgi:hypothetical protein
MTLESASAEEDIMTLFRAAHRSNETLLHNERFLGYFLAMKREKASNRLSTMPYLDMSPEDFVSKTRRDLKWGEAKIAGYFLIIKERIARKEIASDSAHNYRDPIKILLEMNDVTLNWKRLDKILPPRRRKPSKGSAPSKETLRILCSYPDRRIKPIVCLTTSAGLRKGAYHFFTVKDLEPCVIKEKTVCGKLTVYRDEPEEYKTRCSLEAYNGFQEYLNIRRQLGENVGPDSPLVRDLWEGERGGRGLIKYPKFLEDMGVSRLLQDAWAAFPDLRVKIGKRFDIKATHFGRRYFETMCLKAGLDPWEIKVFRGDILPTDLGYQGFTEEEWTQKYLKAMPFLQIFESPAPAEDGRVRTLEEEMFKLKQDQKESEERLRASEERQKKSDALLQEALAALKTIKQYQSVENT